MAYEFQKLSEVEALSEVPEGASVLAEVNGDIKRVPGSGLGGSGGYVIRLEDSFINDDGLFQIDANYDELYDVLAAGGSAWIDFTNAPEAPLPTALSVSNPTNFGANIVMVGMYSLTDVGLVVVDIWDSFTILFPNGSHNLEPIVQPK